MVYGRYVVAKVDWPIYPVLISIADPEEHMRRCESNRDDYLGSPIDVGLKVVYDAIKIGYRLLDGACDYANEKEAGEGVRRAIKDGLVKREDLCKFPTRFGLKCRG